MAKFQLKNYLKVLFEFDPETEDFKLEDNEFVRLVAIKADNDKIVVTKFIKHVAEIEEFIGKYKYNYNIYIGLATTKGENGEAKSMYKRKVLLLDFDKKDYPEYTDVVDFSRHIKGKIPILFNHMVIDTGHGYHYYIATNRYKDNQRMAKDNNEIAKILGADLKATLTTQIARLPTSLNLKDKQNQKLVTIVANNFETVPDKFKPYNLLKIEKMIEDYNRNQELLNKVPKKLSQEYTKCSSYYCIEAMLSKGVIQGERNFALGRITNYLRDIKGLTEYNALLEIQDWNLRCQPPKPPDIIEQDFKAYWNGNYKLLGCNVPDEKDQQIIYRFCDKSLCNSIFEDSGNSIVEGDELSFDNNILKNTYLRNLSGYHYMVISVMDFHKKPMTRQSIVRALTGRKIKKCCISDNTLRKILSELIDKHFITYDTFRKLYCLKPIANYNAGYTRYYYSATLLLINKIISPTEYLVYLCLIRNLQNNTNVTYETIADNLGMDESNVGTAIRGLYDAGAITIDKNYNERGKIYNAYKIVA